jgi:hypothetical protein
MTLAAGATYFTKKSIALKMVFYRCGQNRSVSAIKDT